MTDNNYGRVSAIEDGLTAPQAAKLAGIRQNMALALARRYGERLAPIMSDKLVSEVILRPEVIADLEGVDKELAGVPTTRAGWAEWATDAVAACELSRRSIAASDHELRVQLEQDALAAVPAAQRLSMARRGTLGEHIEQRVDAALEERIIGGGAFV
jgi:hypothetical protein